MNFIFQRNFNLVRKANAKIYTYYSIYVIQLKYTKPMTYYKLF